jgi:hypothetical protein
MHQGNAWEREYKNPKLITKNDGPQADTLRFFKFLKKEKQFLILGVVQVAMRTIWQNEAITSLELKFPKPR